MTTDLVTLINPNLVHPPKTLHSLDLLTTALEDYSYDIEVVDLCLHRDQWTTILDTCFATLTLPLVGAIRNTDNIYGFSSDLPKYPGNLFLLRLSQPGYTGAYWSHRHEILHTAAQDDGSRQTVGRPGDDARGRNRPRPHGPTRAGVTGTQHWGLRHP